MLFAVSRVIDVLILMCVLLLTCIVAVQVFGASNVELVTKQRVEHMTEQDRKQSKKSSNRSPLESLLGIAEKEHHKVKAETNATSSSEQVTAETNATSSS